MVQLSTHMLSCFQATGSWDCCVRLWPLGKNGAGMKCLQGHKSNIHALAFSCEDVLVSLILSSVLSSSTLGSSSTRTVASRATSIASFWACWQDLGIICELHMNDYPPRSSVVRNEESKRIITGRNGKNVSQVKNGQICNDVRKYGDSFSLVPQYCCPHSPRFLKSLSTRAGFHLLTSFICSRGRRNMSSLSLPSLLVLAFQQGDLSRKNLPIFPVHMSK